MTPNAVVHLIELLALAHGISAIFIRIGVRLSLGRVPRSNVAHLYALPRFIRRRSFTEVALLSRATGQQQRGYYHNVAQAAHFNLA
jgi:hypothetical protein